MKVIFCLSGGSISNLYSVLVARYKRFPEIKTKGMAALPDIALFVSEHVSMHLQDIHSYTVYAC